MDAEWSGTDLDSGRGGVRLFGAGLDVGSGLAVTG